MDGVNSNERINKHPKKRKLKRRTLLVMYTTFGIDLHFDGLTLEMSIYISRGSSGHHCLR